MRGAECDVQLIPLIEREEAINIMDDEQPIGESGNSSSVLNSRYDLCRLDCFVVHADQLGSSVYTESHHSCTRLSNEEDLLGAQCHGREMKPSPNIEDGHNGSPKIDYTLNDVRSARQGGDGDGPYDFVHMRRHETETHLSELEGEHSHMPRADVGSGGLIQCSVRNRSVPAVPGRGPCHSSTSMPR
jgi:hypothetical protein